MSDWLITLRKHRNYALRERESGYNTNNQDEDKGLSYAWGSWCDIESKIEYGSCCPLTCPVLKHGVIKRDLDKALKVSSCVVKWDNASGIQMKVTTQLRSERKNFEVIDSDVLQRNIAKLDTSFTNFWKHSRGFPKSLRPLDSFEYKPGRSVNPIPCRVGIDHYQTKLNRNKCARSFSLSCLLMSIGGGICPTNSRDVACNVSTYLKTISGSQVL